MSDAPIPRRWPNRLLRWAVDPWMDYVFWRLDLNTGGRPNHGKVLSTIAFFFGLVGLGIFGTTTVRLCSAVERVLFLAMKGAVPIDPAAIGQLVRACALTTAALLAYAALVFGMPFGLSGFKVWATTKGGGTTEALGQVGAAAAQTSAEIAARRAQGGDDFEVTA